VLERGGDQAAGRDLGDAAGAGAGVGGVVLDQVQGLGDGVFVCLADGVADPWPLVQGPERSSRLALALGNMGLFGSWPQV
jgi:hypothetical protein